MRFPKHPPERNPEYLDWIRDQPCAWCGEEQKSPTEASHHPRQGHGSTALKCSDYRAIPLCGECHRSGMTPHSDHLWVEHQITERLVRWIKLLGEAYS